jgi:O-antigen/teichoic acid export membrane protein
MKLLSKNFNRDVVWSLLGGGIPALAGLIAIPLLVRLLSVDQFALVSLLLSLNLFFFVYDVGLTRTMHFFAPQKAYLSLNGAASLLTSCLFAGFLIGLVVSLVIYWASPSLVLSWLNVNSDLMSESILAFQITAFGIIPALLIHVLKGSMEGRQRFRAANFGKIISGVSLFLFPVLTAFYSKSLVMLAEAILVSRLVSFLVYLRLALHAVSFKSIKISIDITSKLIKYTFWAAISGFFSTLFVYGDRFIVAGYIDASSLAIYITSQDVLIRYLILPWSISVVLVPYFAGHNNGKLFDEFYSKALKSI